jgi:hypothetical protein
MVGIADVEADVPLRVLIPSSSGGSSATPHPAHASADFLTRFFATVFSLEGEEDRGYQQDR